MPSTPLLALAAAVLEAGRRPERVLEIGCGDGEGVLFLSREFPAARVRGLDRSEEMARAAVDRFGLDPEGRIAFKAGDPSSLPYPDEFFDLVVHSSGRLRPAEIARVLREGGDLIVVSKESEGFFARMRSSRQRRGLARHGFEPVAAADLDGEAFFVARLAASA